jgi:hypothetical protein
MIFREFKGFFLLLLSALAIGFCLFQAGQNEERMKCEQEKNQTITNLNTGGK